MHHRYIALLSGGEGLLEQVLLFIFTVVYLGFHELLGCQKCRIRHALISPRDLDLLFILMNLFQGISMAGKFFQLVVQFFLNGNIDLVSPLGNDGNGLIEIARFVF